MIPCCILIIEDDSDRNFMSSLFIEYERLLYKEIYEILNNPWDTEDVLQKTLVKLIEKIPDLRKKEPPKLVNYITTAARHTAYNFLRAQKKIASFSIEDYFEQTAPQGEWRQIEAHLIEKEEIDKLTQRWTQLDNRSKYLLEGRYILGKSDEILAEELSIKPASVRMALTRARQCAYRLLSDEFSPNHL